MCGIFGFSGKFPVDETKIRWLAVMNENRGFHSTGVFTIKADKNRTQTLHKNLDKASTFILKPEFSNAIRGSTLVIGHTRQATVGSISVENAHPFTIGNVTGVHNGFVLQELGTEWIGPKKIFEKEFEVDSQMIFAVLNHFKCDYKKLEKMEGAITTVFNAQDIYPDVLFLYRRQPRDLHIGYSQEGIYFSSLKEPLDLIGCHGVEVIPDNFLVMLRQGEILDVVQLTPPLVPMPEHVTRLGSWKYNLPKEALAAYPQLKEPEVVKKDYTDMYSNYPAYKNGQYNKSKFKTNIDTVEETSPKEDVNDIIGTLVKSVEADITHILPEPIPELNIEIGYEPSDYDCCLLLIKLINDVNNTPIPGFLIYDSDTPKNASVTSLLGVTILKYSPALCSTQRRLVIADPVDGAIAYAYLFKPVNARVMEVTLKLPFQEVQGETISNRNVIHDKIAQLDTLSKFEPAERNLYSPLLEQVGGVSSDKRKNSDSIQGSEESLHSRHEDREIHGDNEDKREDVRHLLSISGKSRNIDNRTGANKLDVFDVASIIKAENSNFKYKNKVKLLWTNKEWYEATSLLNKYLPSILMQSRIINDASVLKLQQSANEGINLSIPHYMVMLLELMPEEYSVRRITWATENISNIYNADEKMQIANFTQSFRNGQLKELDEYLKQKNNLTSTQKKIVFPTQQPCRMTQSQGQVNMDIY